MFLRLLLVTGCATLAAGFQSFAQNPAAPVQPSLVAEGWKHRVWVQYPPEKWKADAELPVEARSESVRIVAAKGEVEPFLLVIRPEVPLREIEARLSALHGPEGVVIPAPSEGARHLGYVYVDEPSGTRMGQKLPFQTGTGLYPDPLLRGAASVRPQHNLQFWVEVAVPRDAAAGVYKGEVVLSWRREGWMPASVVTPLRIPVELTVRSFALPVISPLLNTAYFSTNQLPPAWRTPEFNRSLVRNFGSHFHTPEPLLPSPRIRVLPGGQLEVDWSEWEKEASYVLDDLHLPQIFLPVWSSARDAMQGLYFLWHFPAINAQRWPAHPLPGQPGVFIGDKQGTLSEEFRIIFAQYLRSANALVQKHGWGGRVLVSTMDEPYTAHVSGPGRELDKPGHNYAIVKAFADLVHRQGPALRTFCTSNPVPELDGSIDVWCLRNMDDLKGARQAKAPGAELVLCDNYRTFVDYPMVSARTMGWLCWKAGARGWLTFETMGELETAWQAPVFVYPQFKGGTAWGLGQLFYPDPLRQELIPSVRWKMLRKGAEDYAYLWVLRERLSSLPASEQGSALANEVREFLEHAADGVAGAGSELETGSGVLEPNAQVQEIPQARRAAAAAWIERLEREPANRDPN